MTTLSTLGGTGLGGTGLGGTGLGGTGGTGPLALSNIAANTSGMEIGGPVYGDVTQYSSALSNGILTAMQDISERWWEGIFVPDRQNPSAAFKEAAPWVRHVATLNELQNLVEVLSPPEFDGIQLVADDRIFFEFDFAPSDYETFMMRQFEIVMDYASLRIDRSNEIHTQLGFPTPYFGTILGIHPEKHRYTLELISIAQNLAASLAMPAKLHFGILRPDKMSHAVNPFIPTPGHPSFPAAHAMEAYVVAHLLPHLLSYSSSKERIQWLRLALRKQAARISENRVIAGVHFPIDCIVGGHLGAQIGEILAAFGGAEDESSEANIYRGKLAAEAHGEDPIDEPIRYRFVPVQKGSVHELDPATNGDKRIYKGSPISMNPNGANYFKILWGLAKQEWDGSNNFQDSGDSTR